MIKPEQIKAAALAWERGRALMKSGQYPQAEAQLRIAMKIMPKTADLLADYATLAEKLGDWNAAATHWIALAGLAPARPVGNHVGLALLQLERNAEAVPWLETFAAQNPRDTQSAINLAVAYTRLARDQDAIALLEKVTAQHSGSLLAWESLATLHINAANAAGAERTLTQALKHFPAAPELHYLLMDHCLKSRRFANGFDLFDARWRTRFFLGVMNLPKERRWQGETFDGTLLVRAEQGLGDELLYSSTYPDVATHHAKSVIECDARLMPLFKRSLPALQFIERPPMGSTGTPPPWDKDIMAGDLCRLFRRREQDFPAQAGWLQADPQRVSSLRERYSAEHGANTLRVGISWRSRHPQFGAAKSLALGDWLPVLQIPGVVFFDIQYGDSAAERDALRHDHGIHMLRDDSIDPMQDIDGLAAQMSALDLIISTSNSTVHLAGALGRPTWLLLHRDTGLPWYWAYEGDSVPWYPATEVMRCPMRGAWQPVIAKAAARLQQRVDGVR